jgi:signal transduction histidine kinase
MMAASQGLEGALGGDKTGLAYLGVLNRGLCRQLRLAQHLELAERLSSPDEVRLYTGVTDLVPLCRELAWRLAGPARALGVSVTFATSLSTLPTLADCWALEEMLLCLLSNAIKSPHPGGRLELELETQQDKALLTLRQDGQLPDWALCAPVDAAAWDAEEEDDLRRNFALARQIAALHGGALMADNQEGRGLRLVASIPVRDVRDGGTVCSPRANLNESGGWDKILVELSDCLPAQAYLPEELG